MSQTALIESSLTGIPVRRGKVRDVYDFGDRLLIVATDRISAFDWVLPTGIPDKGRVLTQLSQMWFELLDTTHHLLSMDTGDVPLPADADRAALAGRSMVVRKTRVFPVECVVRGYLSGSGWKEYVKQGSVCGIRLPVEMEESDKLPGPLFTPATKEESGHDINIPFEQMCEIVGAKPADELRRRSLSIYLHAAEYARGKGIIIADTKFEFGDCDGEIILIDEVLTPDSSRFWPADLYEPGGAQPSFDKQFVRDWLETTGWDKNSPPPALPPEVVSKTRAKYIEAYERLSGKTFAWA
ncbi:MAG: phosphoribosylaminoimidazolesuccinocarboxamide synthase [Planctomycetia bacterium]|nr:phosphoribosylaminoimidazolesuccinocarboxamide synthase [Planctomycetia bacterium]